MNYQVCSSSQHKQSETEVKVLLNDQMTQEGSQHDPTHTQKVGDCPRVLILKSNGNMCYIDQQRVTLVTYNNSEIYLQNLEIYQSKFNQATCLSLTMNL